MSFGPHCSRTSCTNEAVVLEMISTVPNEHDVTQVHREVLDLSLVTRRAILVILAKQQAVSIYKRLCLSVGGNPP